MLHRAPEVQKRYDTFICQSNNRAGFIDTMKCQLKKKDYHFVQNDFPYHTTSNIEHWVCWYRKETDPQAIVCELSEKKGIDIITFWKNHSQNMSIQEINHIHVFIQK